ncbi:hypothetical protein M422DRAFT_69605 [Sphaerobolus stellatus SS14]|uniref:Uncharacterized protein n=1 Tax=Sphaerobolus stellatus (strain SS14) TaxID=990650 RepID=A0A0C9UPL8_SPHS4|nr:hypothetical protein M422DRAFT_69605 [Sphaerobolus stellatus SS14]
MSTTDLQDPARETISSQANPLSASALPDHQHDVSMTYCPDYCNDFPRKTVAGPCQFCKKVAAEPTRKSKLTYCQNLIELMIQTWPRCEDCGVGGRGIPRIEPCLCGICKGAQKPVMHMPKLLRVGHNYAV